MITSGLVLLRRTLLSSPSSQTGNSRWIRNWRLMYLIPLTVCLIFSLALISCAPTRSRLPFEIQPLMPDPPSMLLPAGTTRLGFAVESATPAQCRYALNRATSFEQMSPFDFGSGTTHHMVMLTHLSPDPNILTRVYVRCDAYPDFELEVRYRSLSEANPSFPRTGNLWGSWNCAHHGLE